MKKIKEIIVVEGRFDKNTISQVVDATVIETSGFGVFSDREKIELLRRLAEKRGLIILTDSDNAGFSIRGKLSGMLDKRYVKHAYIPDVYGREKRKLTYSKEGKIGVEGMKPDVILKALELTGATFEDISPSVGAPDRITKADMYEIGLSGSVNSSINRKILCERLGLPQRISSNSLLDVLNALYSRDELISTLATIDANKKQKKASR